MKTPMPFESIQSGDAAGSSSALMRARKARPTAALSLLSETSSRKCLVEVSMGFLAVKARVVVTKVCHGEAPAPKRAKAGSV